MLIAFQVLLTIAILAVLAIGGWYLLSLNVDTHDTELKVIMTRLETSAGIYYARLQYFDGVCQDIGVPPGFRCHADSKSYAVEATLATGVFYCIDSRGFHGETRISKGQATSCRDY